MMDKTFDPAAVEARIASAWEAGDAFKSGRPERAGAKPFTMVIPPPNVTGSLHMGHALNNTLQDILCRFERMRGRDVLWQPGTDHAGIATQMVVERRLAEAKQPGRRELGREAFVEKVWAWKAESGGAIVNQLKRLGASCDWSRERFTMGLSGQPDDQMVRAVTKTFVDLHAQGLIYRDKRLVNWDPKFQTAISDLEVLQVEVKGHLWHFDYPIVDEAGSETGEVITVATTRPETMLGDTAVAVHPDDERYTHLVGKHVRLPLVGRLIPIVADTYSDPEKGTGAVKITPAHDFNDFEVGKRAGCTPINILDPEARITLDGNAAFLKDSNPEPEALALHGLDRFEARKRVVALMEARERLRLTEPNTHAVPHGDRSNVVIEPYLTDQWYVNVKPLAERALQAVRDGKTRFVPENYERTFFQWLENIEPWCISRQLWWGHQIPVWYDDEGGIFVASSETEALEQATAKHGRAVALRRDEDVLDTWFSSALWPFSTLGWPDATPELDRYYPTNHLGHWQGHHLLLGRSDDDARPPRHRQGAVRYGLSPHPGARRLGRQDVEVEGQCRRSARPHRPVRRRCPPLHPGRHGRAGQGHQARGEPRRRLPQLRDQALERLALRRDERLRAPRRLPPGSRHRDPEPLGAGRGRARRGRGVDGARRLPLQRRGGGRLPLRLEYFL